MNPTRTTEDYYVRRFEVGPYTSTTTPVRGVPNVTLVANVGCLTSIPRLGPELVVRTLNEQCYLGTSSVPIKW